MQGEAIPEAQTVEFKRGDSLLLCTDGLTGMIPDEKIAALLKACSDPQEGCQALVAAANEAGGKDNVTAVVVEWR
jgi:protein phosphatase